MKKNCKSSKQIIYKGDQEDTGDAHFPYKINMRELTSNDCEQGKCVVLLRMPYNPYYWIYMNEDNFDDLYSYHCHDCEYIQPARLARVKKKLKLLHKMRYTL